jgi:hypothetical protein
VNGSIWFESILEGKDSLPSLWVDVISVGTANRHPLFPALGRIDPELTVGFLHVVFLLFARPEILLIPRQSVLLRDTQSHLG